MSIDEVNRSGFDKRDIARGYARWAVLFDSEQEIIERYAEAFRGRVLDVGVGGGRTTRALAGKAQSYTGIDLSAAMIAAARLLHPTADLRVMDMRDAASAFAGSAFDVILIAFNSIDCINWAHRQRVLGELRALLAPNGLLVFSTHDLDAIEHDPPRFRLLPTRAELGPLSSPRDWAKGAVRAGRWIATAWPNRIRNRKLERHFGDYAYLNDAGETWGLITCYVRESAQRSQLAEAGFAIREVVAEPSNDHWRYFVCECA